MTIRALVAGGGPTKWYTVHGDREGASSLSFGSGASADPDDDINMLCNGSLESSALGLDRWIRTSESDVTVSRETVAPISGTGSIKVVLTADTGGTGVFLPTIYFDEGFDWGATFAFSFSFKGAGDLLAYFDYTGAADVDEVWTGAATEESQDVFVPGLVVPINATDLQIQIGTNWDGGQTNVVFWLDNCMFYKTALAP